MLIDTHCHINMIVKKTFDIPLTKQEIEHAAFIMQEAAAWDVQKIINVGTSLIESKNCIALAQTYADMFAAIGIHPNDCTSEWKSEYKQLEQLINNPQNKIVAIGEIGLDKHYEGFNLPRQIDAFKTQIESALKHNLPIIVHTRQAPEETLEVLETYRKDNLHGIIHCFSEDLAFAKTVIEWGYVLGIGGTLTYPNNNLLRNVVENVELKNIVLETDAPFLPPQNIRGKQNHPKYIKTIAEYIAELKYVTLSEVAMQTTSNVENLFPRMK